MVAPPDEMNEEQHLRPLCIFNIDANFVTSKKKLSDEKREQLFFQCLPQHKKFAAKYHGSV